jgi:hypothetical protein
MRFFCLIIHACIYFYNIFLSQRQVFSVWSPIFVNLFSINGAAFGGPGRHPQHWHTLCKWPFPGPRGPFELTNCVKKLIYWPWKRCNLPLFYTWICTISIHYVSYLNHNWYKYKEVCKCIRFFLFSNTCMYMFISNLLGQRQILSVWRPISWNCFPLMGQLLAAPGTITRIDTHCVNGCFLVPGVPFECK